MVYFPNEKVNLEDAEQVRAWLLQELRSISREFNETTSLELRPRSDVPKRPREGMIIYADGTVWNPGSGEGLYVYKNGAWVKVAEGQSGRPLLLANRTYYVRTDGSDANSGLVDSAGGAFLTIQKAIDVVQTLDLGGFAVTIQVRSGTYTAGATVTFPFLGGLVTLQGDVATPSNCVISVANACILVANPGSVLTVKGFKLVSSGGYGLQASATGVINVSGNMEYGACSIASINADNNAIINVQADYTLSGAGSYHYNASYQGTINCIGRTVTQVGTLAFTTYANAERLGMLVNFNGTFSGGTITGNRYNVTVNAIIFTNGGGANYFPGNVAGAASSGGQYV